jgi:hypothetical protein
LIVLSVAPPEEELAVALAVALTVALTEPAGALLLPPLLPLLQAASKLTSATAATVPPTRDFFVVVFNCGSFRFTGHALGLVSGVRPRHGDWL